MNASNPQHSTRITKPSNFEDMTVNQPRNIVPTIKASPRQGGWAMLETLVAIILGLLLLIGVFVYYQMATSGTNIGELRQNIMLSKSNTERLFKGQPSYEGLDNALAVRAKLIPSSMVMGDTNSTDITTTFGGDVIFASDTGGTYGAANSHYSITVEDVPQEACIEMGTYTRTDWVDVVIEGTSIDENSVAAASTACANEDANTLVFWSR